MKPGSAEAMELASALARSIAFGSRMQRLAEDRRKVLDETARYQVPSLIFATLAGAFAALAAVLSVMQP